MLFNKDKVEETNNQPVIRSFLINKEQITILSNLMNNHVAKKESSIMTILRKTSLGPTSLKELSKRIDREANELEELITLRDRILNLELTFTDLDEMRELIIDDNETSLYLELVDGLDKELKHQMKSMRDIDYTQLSKEQFDTAMKSHAESNDTQIIIMQLLFNLNQFYLEGKRS